MSPAALTPPTRVVRFLCVVIGIAVFASQGKEHWGKPGMYVGVFVGGLAGWLLGWWVKRSFLEF